MEGVEMGTVLLLLLAALRVLWSAPAPEWFPTRLPETALSPIPVFVAVAVWLALNGVLDVTAADRAVAAAEMRRVSVAAAAFAAGFLARFPFNWRRRIFVAWSAAAGALSLYGLLQRTGGVGRVVVPQMDRIMASYGNAIFFAAFLVPSLFLAAGEYFATRRPFVKKELIAVLAVELVALYLSGTRAAWIAVAVVAAGFAGLRWGFRRIPPWTYAVTVVLAGLFVFQTRNIWKRDQGHLLIWRDTIRMWADHPWRGVGLGAFHVDFPAYAQPDLRSKWPKSEFIVNDAHNEYLQVLSEGGVPLAASFMAILVLFFRWLRRRVPTSADFDDRPWIAAAVAALLVQAFFSVDMRFGVSFVTAFLLMGIATGEELSPAPDASVTPSIARVAGSVLSVALAALAWPVLRAPYRAQQTVSAMKGFFDQRLLDPVKSMGDLEALARDYPNEIPVLEKLAFVYAKEIRGADGHLDPGMAANAIRVYERILTLDPRHAAACNNLGNIHYTIGQVDEAIAMWKRAVEIKPDFLDPHLNLGKILYTRGDLKESARQFDIVLQLDPGNAEAVVYLKRMVE